MSTMLKEPPKYQRLVREYDSDLNKRKLVNRWSRDRRCLGLGLMLGIAGVEALAAAAQSLEEHGHVGTGRVIFHNDEIEWLAIRDVPWKRFPKHPDQRFNTAEVNYASTARGHLVHGMPWLQFDSATINDKGAGHLRWNHRILPFRQHRKQIGDGLYETVKPNGGTLDAKKYPAEFALANAVSAKMTNLALNGVFPADYRNVEARGKPLSPAWFAHRPEGSIEYPPFPPRIWFPVPLVTVPELGRDLAQLYRQATSVGGHDVYDCPSCSAEHSSDQIKLREEFNTEWCSTGGWFIATCPGCSERRKYFIDDARHIESRYFFSHAFRDQFTEAVAAGLPIRARGSMAYIGERKYDSAVYSRLPLTTHVFKLSGDDNAEVLISLPKEVKLDTKPGHIYKSGEVICHALAATNVFEILDKWGRQDPKDRWMTVGDVVGGREWVPFLQELWWTNQIVYLPQRADGSSLDSTDTLPGHQVAIPADLLGPAMAKITVGELWWDMTLCAHFADPEVGGTELSCGGIALPAIPISRWDRLMFGENWRGPRKGRDGRPRPVQSSGDPLRDLPGGLVIDARIVDPRLDKDVRNSGTNKPKKKGKRRGSREKVKKQ